MSKEIVHQRRCTELNAASLWKDCLKPVSLLLNRKVEMSNSCGGEKLTSPAASYCCGCKAHTGSAASLQDAKL